MLMYVAPYRDPATVPAGTVERLVTGSRIEDAGFALFANVPALLTSIGAGALLLLVPPAIFLSSARVVDGDMVAQAAAIAAGVTLAGAWLRRRATRLVERFENDGTREE